MIIHHVNTDSKLYKSLSSKERVEYERMSKAHYELKYFSGGNINKISANFKSD